MIVPDVNLQLCAHLDGFEQRSTCRDWWADSLSGREVVGLAPVVIAAFVRLTTSPRVLERPLRLAEGTEVVDSWLSRGSVQVLVSDKDHLRLAFDLLQAAGTAGNLVTDAMIAAHALQHGAVVATNEVDFARFPKVATLNPLSQLP